MRNRALARPVVSSISDAIARQVINSAAVFSPADLFVGGRTGYALAADSGVYSDFQGALATTGQTSALVLEGSEGRAEGPDLVDTANTAAAWTAFGTNTVADDGGEVRVTYVDNGNGAGVDLTAAGGLSSNLTAGKVYKVTFLARVTAASSLSILIDQATTTVTRNLTSVSLTPVTFYFVADGAGERLRFAGMNGIEEVWISQIVVKEVAGNHAYQPTAADRPVLATVGGFLGLQGDGVSDYLINNGVTATQRTIAVSWYGVLDGTLQSVISASSAEELKIAATTPSQARQEVAGTTTVRSAPKNAWHVVIARADATTNYLSVDGSETSVAATPVSAVFDRIFCRGATAGTTPFSGYIRDAVLIDESITDAEKAQLESYFAGRCGVTLA